MTGRPAATYRGRCHCGRVIFEATTAVEELTTCDCSMCKRRGAVMFKVHESGFWLLAGKGVLGTYRFHTRTAVHHFCTICGIYTFHRKRVTPDHYGINIGCLDDFDPTGLPVRETHGSGMA